MKFDRPLVSVCIVTRNRKDNVVVTVESALAQDYPALEVRVYDNGSEDGTAEALQTSFPSVHLARVKENSGAAALRNQCFRESGAKYVVSLDDDSYFTDPNTVTAAAAFLEKHGDVAVLALPFVEPASRGMKTWTPPSDPGNRGIPVRSFVACACVFRRQAVLGVGGYREFFEQWGEERDLSIRLMDRGHSIIFAYAPLLVHTGSPQRNRDHMEELGVRNTILFDWLNLPRRYLFPRLTMDSLGLMAHKLTRNNIGIRARYVARGLKSIMAHRTARNAIKLETYRHYRSLEGHGPIAVLDRLPPPLVRTAPGESA